MNKKNIRKITDMDIVESFENFLDEALTPDSQDEAEKIIQEAGIDPARWNHDVYTMVQNLLRESPLNWRNVREEEITREVKELERIPRRLSKSKQKLIEMIEACLAEIYPSKKRVPAAYRNFKEITREDMASLLQELEYQVQKKREKDNG